MATAKSDDILTDSDLSDHILTDGDLDLSDCTLKTDQPATKVTATLDGNSAKTMTGSGKSWSCTFSPFSSTGTRTVTFSATATNGKTITVKKTFTVKQFRAVTTTNGSPICANTAKFVQIV